MKSSITPHKRKILKEDEYQASLSQIISRDYFPEINELKKQVELQQRLDAGDIPGAIQINNSYRLLESRRKDENEKDDQEEHVADDSGGVRVVSRPLHLESLSGFHARVTSEDNASFDKVQNEEIKLRSKITERCSTSTFTAKRAPPALRSSSHAMSPLQLASDHFDAPSHQFSVTECKNESNNSLFFVPEARQKYEHPLLTTGDPSEISGARSQDKISGSMQSMPPPIKREILVKCISKKRLSSQKEIVPSATRFPSKGLAQISTTNNDWDVESQIDYFSSTDDSSATTDLDRSPAYPLHVEKMQAIRQRDRDINSFVRMTPLIIPGQNGAVDSSPLVTWGTVEGTPLVMPSSDIPASPAFQFPQKSDRDDAAANAQKSLGRRIQMVQQANSVQRAKRSMKDISFNPSDRKSRPLSARSGKSFGSALRRSYLRTPGSLQRESTSRNMKSVPTDTAHRLTPHLPRKLG